MNQLEATLQPLPSPFYGPSLSGRYHGRRRCHLVLISNPLVNHESDFHRIADYIQQYDPKIKTTVVTNRWRALTRLLPRSVYPTLGISFVSLARFRPPRGRFLYGKPLSKSEEYIALEQAGFAVPKWQLLRAGDDFDLSDYGPYVVTKPNHGMQGSMVNIVRTDRVRGHTFSMKNETHPASDVPESQHREMLAQQFIYTGEWPVKYRVSTLFGKVLYSLKSEASRERNRLSGPKAFEECGVTAIVDNGEGCRRTMNYDEEIIQLGEAAAAVFPDIPMLGFDIVREVPSGKLYILEANAIGYVWHFSSSSGIQVQRDNNLNLEGQFDGLRKAAHILAAKTQELAR